MVTLDKNCQSITIEKKIKKKIQNKIKNKIYLIIVGLKRLKWVTKESKKLHLFEDLNRV